MPSSDRHWTCPQQHRWNAPADPPPSCPVCGQPGSPASLAISDDQPTVGAGPGAVPSSPKDGVHVEGYEILEEVGRGGMGVVYKARQHGLNRLVALKMILAAEHAGEDQIKRFQAEAEAIAQLQHPHIVQIYDVSQAGERPFFSMEFVDGGSLAGKLTGHPLPVRPSALLIESLARAMHYAHERGIIHRDLKPGNILLAPLSSSSDSLSGGSSLLLADFPLGLPKVTDFGLAKRLNSAGPTQSGAVMGTPSYMAPEQAAGKSKEIGPAADIYALGSILYEMLTGRPPFRAESAIDTLMQVMRDDPLPPSRLRPKLPRDLEIICLKCLRKTPENRYTSALALADDLRRFVTGEPIAARPASVIQRGRRWVRRHPVWAASIAIGALMGGLLLGGGLDYHFKLKREMERTAGEKIKTDAEKTQAMQRLVRLTVANGMQHLNDEDLLGSLPWFAEALRLDAGDAEREEMHRIRLAAVLRQSPRLARVRFHDGRVRDAAFSPDGQFFLSGGDDGLAIVDSIAANKTPVVAKSGGNILHVAFDRSGKRFLTICDDHTVFVWNAATGELLGNPLSHDADVAAALFTPDGERVLTACADHSARVWEVAKGEQIGPALKQDAAVRCAAWHPDGKQVATGGSDGIALIWNLLTGEPVSLPMAHKGAIVHIAFAPDGKQLLTASADHSARLWEVPTGIPASAVFKHMKAVTWAEFSPDGKHVVTAGEDNLARVWDAATGSPVTPALKHSSQVYMAAFSPDGRWIVTAGDDNTARVWDAKTGDAVAPPLKHNGSVFRATFTPDGRHVLTASLDGLARVWVVGLAPHAVGGELAAGPPKRSVYSPDGQRMLMIGAGGVCTLRDSSSGAQIGPELNHGASVRHAAFSPDGTRLLTASEDRSARVWDARTAEPVGKPMRHGSSVGYAAFSADGKRIATASDDNTARVWDAATGMPLSPPLRHHGSVLQVAFSPDGRAVLTASADGAARLWDAQTGESLTPILPRTGWVQQALTAPSDERGWNLSADRRPVEQLLRLAQWLSGQRIDETGGMVPLDTDALKEIWHKLRSEQPADLELSSATRLSWHQRAAEESERKQDWYAATAHLGELLTVEPANLVFRLHRARALAELQDWPRAAADFAAVRIQRPDDLDLAISCAVSQLGAGDRSGAHRTCAVLRKLGKAAGGEMSLRVAWTCTLAADSEDAEATLGLAERARSANSDGDRGDVLRGAALFRAGRWPDALRSLQDGQATTDSADAVRAWIYLSMTDYRLDRVENARRLLTRAQTWMNRDGALAALPWPQRLELTLLRGEAEALVGALRHADNR